MTINSAWHPQFAKMGANFSNMQCCAVENNTNEFDLVIKSDSIEASAYPSIQPRS
jgi:hypothetical protein